MTRSDLDQATAIAAAVDRYIRTPSALEHERLLPLIEQSFGPEAADFFDREGQLPLRAKGLPWPMRPAQARAYVLAVLGGSMLGAVWALTFLWTLVPSWVAVVAALAAGAALWFGIPALTRLVPPADLEERERLVRVFDENSRRDRDAAEERAMEARMGRLLGENDTSPDA